MISKRNLVAHYQKGSSDKVYMSCVRFEKQSSGAELWLVMGKWGKRGGTLSSQIKLTTTSETEAVLEQMKLFKSKLREGYEDVDSSAYQGPVSRGGWEIAACLEDEGGKPKDASVGADEDLDFARKARALRARQRKAEGEKARKKGPAEDLAAVCMDRDGLEDKFDEGIEYVFEEHKDEAMIWVYDKLGEKGEYFKDRFRIVSAT